MSNPSIDINDALNNDFFRNLLENQHTASENIIKRNGFTVGKNNYHLLSNNEKKSSRTFRLTSDLIAIINDIRITYALINRRPTKLYLEKHDISELDYIKFHFEVFIHKVHTICEILKLIANEVLNINLHPKDCNWKNLDKHPKFKSSICKNIIQQYYNDFENLIEHRNLNTHRGIYYDKEMDDINITYNIYRHYNKLNLSVDEEYQKLFPYRNVQIRIESFKKNKLKEILTFEQLILNHVKNFFNSLV